MSSLVLFCAFFYTLQMETGLQAMSGTIMPQLSMPQSSFTSAQKKRKTKTVRRCS